MMGARWRVLVLGLFLAGALMMNAGECEGGEKPKQNPSFPLSAKEARAALKEMRKHPKKLQRPVVVLGGWFEPGIIVHALVWKIRKLTGDKRVIGVSFEFNYDFDSCRKKVIERVERAFPSDDPEWTTEVDVIAVSMGGLVARYAAMPVEKDEPKRKRLRIKRLFTISTPHRGAALAKLPTWNKLQKDMRHGSKFLKQLNSTKPDYDYTIYPYARLDDVIVGVENTAPPGQTPWWLPNLPFECAHLGACHDPRTQADILRRLRGEKPYTTYPPAPIPKKEKSKKKK